MPSNNDIKVPVLYERIAELEAQLTIVRDAATVGAESDAIKIQQLNKTIIDLQEENKLLRDELMQLRGHTPLYDTTQQQQSPSESMQSRDQTQLNDTAKPQQSTSESYQVSADQDDSTAKMDKVSLLISQSQRDIEWLTQETNRRRESLGALRQRSSRELINMKKRLSL